MGRSDLLDQMVRATSPDETSTAIFHARIWLAAHPDDQTLRSAMEDLIEVERQSLT